MAHSGACCNNHCTCNVNTGECASHRSVCSSNRTNFTDNNGDGYTINAGTAVKALHMTELRDAIRQELTERNNHANYTYNTEVTLNVSAGDIIDDSHINTINNAIMRIDGQNLIPSSWVSAYGINFHRSRIRDLEDDCICNSDGQTYCSCHNNCGCNYSDVRLKENIALIGQYKGLNIYTYTYIWDNVTKYMGVMAQEILSTKYKDAVTQNKQGYYMVNYNKLLKGVK